MERVFMMDCGDAVRRADNGCFGKGPVVKTADYAITVHQTGTIFSNSGADGAVVFSLPAPRKGLWFTFIKAAAQNLSIQATGGAKINGGVANKKYENTAAEAATCTLVSDGADWYVAAEKGTWANNDL